MPPSEEASPITHPTTPAQSSEAVERLPREILATYHHLRRVAGLARRAVAQEFDGVAEAHAADLKALESSVRQERQQIEAGYQSDLAEASSRFTSTVDEIRHGQSALTSRNPWRVLGWDDPAWTQYAPVETSDARGVRIGSFRVGDDENSIAFPAVVPLLGSNHLFIMGSDPANQDAVRGLLRTILLRQLLSAVPGTVRLCLVDPVGLGANLSMFLELPEVLRGQKVYCRPEEIHRQLADLEDLVERTIQQGSHQTRAGHVLASSAVPARHTVLALVDFPAGFNERTAEQIVNLARSGTKAGLSILASVSESQPVPRGLLLEALTRLSGQVRLDARGCATWDDLTLGHHDVVPDPPPDSARAIGWLQLVGRAVLDAPTSVPIESIAIRDSERWASSTAGGLSAPIGVSMDGEILELSLGRGVVHHGLIGGITQSGKTNLLHVLITQLALRYSPSELELYLLDFKEGVEFQDYLTFGLPHLRVVALESEREFGLSVLRRLRDEIEQRGERFRHAGVTRLSDYRQEQGRMLPRVLAVLDEFQVLFIEDDRLAQEAGRLLEDIARRGASFGVHLLLSSQSPSGGPISGRRIYDQMALRIALRCRAQDAAAILGEGNDAASRLERSGEAVYNDEMGHRDKNVFLRVALLTEKQRRATLSWLRQRAGQEGPRVPMRPVTFEGRSPARLEDDEDFRELQERPDRAGADSPVRVWLGQPIEIKTSTVASIERYAGSNLLIAGGDEAQAYGLLACTILSVAAQRKPAQARFFALDFSRPGSPYYNFVLGFERGLEHELRVVGPNEAISIVGDLLDILKARAKGDRESVPELYVLICGLHRWRDLRPPDPYGQTETGKQLQRLAEEGPELGLHLIIWTDEVASLERAIKRTGLSAFDLRVVLRVSEADSNSLLGSPAAARLEDNRAYFRHEEWELGRLEKFKPYTVSDPTTLVALLNRPRIQE